MHFIRQALTVRNKFVINLYLFCVVIISHVSYTNQIWNIQIVVGLVDLSAASFICCTLQSSAHGKKLSELNFSMSM